MARVLIVDDEHPVRNMIVASLAGLGHSIREAESAEAALATLADMPAGVVFCDVQMPGQDGLWLTKRIRNLYPATAVILATGISTAAPNISMQAGVMAYLVKPFSRQVLRDALAVAVEWNHAVVLAGPRPEDSGRQLQDWLDLLDQPALSL